MEDHIIELIIPMNDPCPDFCFVRQVRCIPFDHLVEKGNRASGLISGYINSEGLGLGDAGERFDLTGKVGCRGAEGGEAKGEGV